VCFPEDSPFFFGSPDSSVLRCSELRGIARQCKANEVMQLVWSLWWVCHWDSGGGNVQDFGWGIGSARGWNACALFARSPFCGIGAFPPPQTPLFTHANKRQDLLITCSSMARRTGIGDEGWNIGIPDDRRRARGVAIFVALPFPPLRPLFPTQIKGRVY